MSMKDIFLPYITRGEHRGIDFSKCFFRYYPMIFKSMTFSYLPCRCALLLRYSSVKAIIKGEKFNPIAI